VIVLASRGDGDGGDANGDGGSRAPVPSPTVTTAAGTELSLLAGRVVVAARPGWQKLDSTDQTGSVRLALRDPAGRELLSTLGIALLSSPRSLDTTLRITGGTPFEVTGADGTFRVTAQPGPAARIVAGAVRPRGTFFLSITIFSVDGRDIDLPTLRKLFTEQVVPALRFP